MPFNPFTRRPSSRGAIESLVQSVFGTGVRVGPSESGIARALLGLLGLGGKTSGRRQLPKTLPQFEFPESAGTPVKPPAPPQAPTRQSFPPPDRPEPPTFFSPKTPNLGEQPKEGEVSPYGPQIHLTPQSSNVYSFSYYRRPGDTTGTLYVRFKAHRINPHGVARGKGRLGGREQLHGTPGATVLGGERANEPGAMYAYYRVPPGVYRRMISAHSKGKFVWDNLRIRGTIYGHKYAYANVEGQAAPGGTYIPRRATKTGFRTRSLADIGAGRRGYESSTLPEQRGYSSRRR